MSKKVQRWLFLVGYIAVFAALAWVATVPLFANFWPVFLIGAGLFPCLWLFAFSIVLIHEAGHGLAALACGRKIRWVSILGVLLARDRKGWYVGRSRDHAEARAFSMGGIKHSCNNATGPTEVFIYAAGPLLSLSICFALYFGKGIQSWEKDNIGLWWIMAANGFIGFMSLSPYIKGGAGHFLQYASHDYKEFKVWLRQLAWHDILTDTRPAEWDVEAYARDYGDMHLEEASTLHICFQHAHDKGDLDAAERYLRKAWEALDSKTLHTEWKPIILFDVVTFFTLFRPDPDLANEAWELASNDYPGAQSSTYAEIARLLVAGDRNAAQAKADELLAKLDQQRVLPSQYAYAERRTAQLLSWQKKQESEDPAG